MNIFLQDVASSPFLFLFFFLEIEEAQYTIQVNSRHFFSLRHLIRILEHFFHFPLGLSKLFERTNNQKSKYHSKSKKSNFCLLKTLVWWCNVCILNLVQRTRFGEPVKKGNDFSAEDLLIGILCHLESIFVPRCVHIWMEHGRQ